VTNIRKVTVFGGTGFLGRRVVQHLLDHGFAVRVASRHPERGAQVSSNTLLALEFVKADVGDDGSVMTAVAGTFGVVNAVSLYVERGNQTFRSVHVEAAARVAKHSRASGVQRLVHVSGIGVDARSPSAYIRSRGEGETSVCAAFSAATIIRPAVMFGPDDAFLTSLMKMLQMFPVFPCSGGVGPHCNLHTSKMFPRQSYAPSTFRKREWSTNWAVPASIPTKSCSERCVRIWTFGAS
jgi:uncharacterized protein YbjT (DUF2867 family)